MSWKAIRHFFISKINILLVFAFVSLLGAFGIITGIVTVPDFRHRHGTVDDSRARYAVIPEDFADPCLISDGWNWYAFATRTNEKVHIQMASAPLNDISRWTLHRDYDALPRLGAWVASQLADPAVWAPYIIETVDHRNGTFVMYYSALSRNSTSRHCIGVAISLNITGPYLPQDKPLVCDLDKGGVIDPAYFYDPLTDVPYLVYKQDGNAVGVGGSCGNTGWPNAPTPLLALELSLPELTTTIGEPFELLSNIQYDGPNIEAPSLWAYIYERPENLRGGQIRSYHIVFNSGCFADKSYRIEHIICIAHPGQGLRDCMWSNIRGDPAHPGQDTTNGGGIYTSTMLQTGDTDANLYAPGGASLCAGSQPGSLAGNVNKRYMIFHADVNMAYFEHAGPISQKERIDKGWDRRRGMFVAELEYWGQEDMLKVNGLVKPTNE